MTLPASLEQIPVVTEFIDVQLEALDCPLRAQTQIDVAIDELFSNIARYAYEHDTGDVVVDFDFAEADRMVTITFSDGGKPFDPLGKEDPDVTLTAEERDIGGLGIFLVKKTMDQVTYRYENGLNILTIQKKI